MRLPAHPVIRALGALCLLALAWQPVSAAPAAPAERRALQAFAGEREFDALLARWREAARSRAERRSAETSLAMSFAQAPAAAPAALASKAAADGAASESITNVQTAGVDEGGIVKRAGDHLVILRRGRLFTVNAGDDTLRPVATVDAYAPGSDPRGAWYDELLVHDGRTVVVVGYSAARGGTEIGLFELGRDGSLAWRATHHLRSHDYYSSRNYASRLVGSRLVFYTPMPIDARTLESGAYLPQWRRWQARAPADWQRILPATRIFRTDDEPDPAAGGAALHTVTSCELSRPEAVQCEASAVLGPPGRVFYVSATGVYVWTTESSRRQGWGLPPPVTGPGAMARSAVFRLPLDGSAPTALKTTGSPVDALSFLEDDSGHLNVLLRSGAHGDAMWQAERGTGALALLRVPVASFGDGRGAAPRGAYRPLPSLPGHALHNRYVGDWLLVGAGGAGAAGEPLLGLRYAAPGADRGAARRIALPHGVERIEALGRHALIVGRQGRDLHFTSLRLSGDLAEPADTLVRRDAAQGDTRTHGFFYRALGGDEGLLGLPVRTAGPARAPGAGRASAAVQFLHQRGLGLHAAGELQAHASAAPDDACRASCVDWYGNARPIFMGTRVFALLGYELVEGRVSRGGFWPGAALRIEELRRVDFAPQPALAWGRD